MSAASAKLQDPSMEEILASIRRIIADDQDGTPTTGEASEGQPSEAKRALPAEVEVPAEAEAVDEDILDLAEFPETAQAAKPSLETETVDLSFQEAPDPVPVAPPAPPPTITPVPPPVDVAPPAPVPSATVEPETRLPLERLLSDRSGASIGQSFNLLSNTVLAHNNITIEDIVKDMLKPLLRDWLDDNLPPLVERLVRAEIERVARGAR